MNDKINKIVFEENGITYTYIFRVDNSESYLYDGNTIVPWSSCLWQPPKIKKEVK